MLTGFGVRFVSQVAYFVLVARTLGSSGYGTFVGATALVSIFVPFSSLGTGNLLVKNVSRDRNAFRIYWGNAVAVTASTGIVLFGLVMALSTFLLPPEIPPLLVALVCLSDLFFFSILNLCGQVFQATENMKGSAGVYVLFSLFRLAAALTLFFLFEDPTPLAWGGLYLASGAASGGLCFLLVARGFGLPRLAFLKDRAEFREGFHFSLTVSSQSVYNDIDKTMLARMQGVGAAGTYAAAYRFCDAAFMPVGAILYAAYSRFFLHGEKGIRGTLGYVRKILPVAGSYSLAAGILLFFAGPWLPKLLGGKYSDSVEALRWLSLLPLLRTVHYFGADALTGAGHQILRSYIQVGVAVFNVVLNLLLIPLYSWRGAAWASLASNGLMAASVWFIVYLYSRDGKKRNSCGTG
jgi:O-antigen/teichoic acid export membrane protein